MVRLTARQARVFGSKGGPQMFALLKIFAAVLMYLVEHAQL